MIDQKTVRALIAKSIELQDQELMQMGIDLLNSMTDNKVVSKPEVEEIENKPIARKPRTKKEKPVKKVEQKVDNPKTSDRINKANIADQFKVKKTATALKYIPVQGRGVNEWFDDLSEFTTAADATPKIKIAPRQRKPITKVEVICGQNESGEQRDDEGCGQVFMVNPSYAREYFLCDDCLDDKRKGK